nr:hypothetical protein GCM10017745_75730 [Saccharothrix mutabilis subsp. capreolus]
MSPPVGGVRAATRGGQVVEVGQFLVGGTGNAQGPAALGEGGRGLRQRGDKRCDQRNGDVHPSHRKAEIVVR